MSTNINVNVLTKVILTDAGAKVINDYIKNNNVIRYLTDEQIKTLFGQNKFKSGDTYKSTLWEIMNIFGKSMYMGCETPFYNNELTLDEKLSNKNR